MALLLETRALTKDFGGLRAVDSVDFHVAEGEIVSIIGPNGSGKTTFFNVVSGVLLPTSGRVLLGGLDVTGLPSHRVTALGVSRTFQTIRLFRQLTVIENVLVGRHCRTSSGVVDALVQSPRLRREMSVGYDMCMGLLEFVGLAGFAAQPASALPYGLQRRLEIARALATEPRLLLLDEPAAGMNPAEVDALLGLIRRVRNKGITIVLIEHQMRLVMKVAERVVVFDHGCKISEGNPADVRNDPRVVEAYLGSDRRGYGRPAEWGGANC